MSYPSQLPRLQTQAIPNFVVLPRGEVCFYQTVPTLLMFDMEDIVRPFLAIADTDFSREQLTWEIRSFLFKGVYDGVLCKDLRGRWIYRPGDLQ